MNDVLSKLEPAALRLTPNGNTRLAAVATAVDDNDVPTKGQVETMPLTPTAFRLPNVVALPATPVVGDVIYLSVASVVPVAAIGIYVYRDGAAGVDWYEM